MTTATEVRMWRNLAISPRIAPEFCLEMPCPPLQRAQGRPGARCTRGLVRKIQIKNAHEHTGSAEAVRPSLRNGFNGFLRALLGDRALLSPSPAKNFSPT
jgi:hypothetical protein